LKVLVVGSGAREHALAWRLGLDGAQVMVAPGNGGTPNAESIAATDLEGLIQLAQRERVDLTIVGPEGPLAMGLVDTFVERGLAVFGPTRAAARLEWSKGWAKDFFHRHGIPTAAAEIVQSEAEARRVVARVGLPVVLKADGLAAGKGVTVAEDHGTAVRALQESLVDRAFGDAGSRVLVEEFLEGREVSAIAITDGRHVVPLSLAQDFKRAGDGDTGPNTGGMGAYSPVPFVDDATRNRIVAEILEPTVRAMEAEGVRYRGVLYAGLMLTDRGPLVLEFNARLGDPETQAILPRLDSDLGELFLATVEGNLSNYRVHWRDEACVTVVLASGGYPGEHATGLEISGLDAAAAEPDVEVFHAGTAVRDGRVVTAGGRVLAVSAQGKDLAEARDRAYAAAALISFEGMHYRTDIAAVVAGAGSG
jgi:phosphoribosylamine--glycine ligase